jgi:hypothetical protein
LAGVKLGGVTVVSQPARPAAMHTPLPRWVMEIRNRRIQFLSAALSITDDLLRRGTPRLRANSGCEQVQQRVWPKLHLLEHLH